MIETIKADITAQAVDAILNAAGPGLRGGGGVDGASPGLDAGSRCTVN